jgi:hypothetical protein
VLYRCQIRCGRTKRGKGSKIMAIADGKGMPLAIVVASAWPHETKLVGATLEARFIAVKAAASE